MSIGEKEFLPFWTALVLACERSKAKAVLRLRKQRKDLPRIAKCVDCAANISQEIRASFLGLLESMLGNFGVKKKVQKV